MVDHDNESQADIHEGYAGGGLNNEPITEASYTVPPQEHTLQYQPSTMVSRPPYASYVLGEKGNTYRYATGKRADAKTLVTTEDHYQALRDHFKLPADATLEQIHAMCQEHGMPTDHQYPTHDYTTAPKSTGHYMQYTLGESGNRYGGPYGAGLFNAKTPLERAKNINENKDKPREPGI